MQGANLASLKMKKYFRGQFRIYLSVGFLLNLFIFWGDLDIILGGILK